jgi:hypothetical protein
MQSLRSKTARIEFVFNDGDEKHPLVELLAEFGSVRTIGVEVGNGYCGKSRPNVVKRSYPYDRDIIRAIESLGGGLFPGPASNERWTELGDVDVIFLDKDGKMLGATVAHGAMIITPADEES